METPVPPAPQAVPPDYSGIMRRAAAWSRYAARLLESQPELAPGAALGRPFGAEEMRAFLDGERIDDAASLHRALRTLRKLVMLRLIARDLGGLADLREVVATATRLAETAIGCAARHLASRMAQEYGTPRGEESGEAQELLVVGMGKLGGEELNVSSDVDLIFVYPEDGESDGARRISNHEYFTLLGRRLIAALSEITADGYVFRVDMRLRPFGEGSALACSFAALENYFISHAREWERYAWIKARAVSGAAERELMQVVRPFVFRRHLDFGALNALRDLHRQIREEVRRRDMHGDIKLGPGGIREIEFVAQVFQLIRGGRDAGLRLRPTLAVLDSLEQRRLLPPQAAAELREAYVFLRNLEHRLQYLEDRQTQSLPENGEERALIAQAMGFAAEEGFRERLEFHRRNVTRHFEQVFAAQAGEPSVRGALWHESDEAGAAERLAALGYGDPLASYRRLRQFREGARYRNLSATGQTLLDHLAPRLIEAAAAHPNSGDTLERMLQLLESISRRESYFALLAEYPQAVASLAKLLSASPWAAQYLAQHPILLDELLDARALYGAPDWSALRAELEAQLHEAENDTERQMDILRHFKQAQTFRLLAQDLAGLVRLEHLSDHLSDLAGLILEQTLRLCWQSMRVKHRAEPRFAVIGYGKLGGKELGYASDLDLIFLYDDDSGEAPEIYARLAQRINTWLTSYLPSGVLYETDLRLRPDGAAGLLVSSLQAFAEYQEKSAWVWEHQALTRARFVAGDAGVGRSFEALRERILRLPRDLPELKKEILAMRRKMLEAHPNDSGLFDLKHDRGGIIDVEFTVQYLVLGHAGAHPELTGNIGNLALLKLAGELGLTPPDLAAAAHDAYREFRLRQHALRLQGERYARVEAAGVRERTAAVLALWREVFGEA